MIKTLAVLKIKVHPEAIIHAADFVATERQELLPQANVFRVAGMERGRFGQDIAGDRGMFADTLRSCRIGTKLRNLFLGVGEFPLQFVIAIFGLTYSFFSGFFGFDYYFGVRNRR